MRPRHVSLSVSPRYTKIQGYHGMLDDDPILLDLHFGDVVDETVSWFISFPEWISISGFLF